MKSLLLLLLTAVLSGCAIGVRGDPSHQAQARQTCRRDCEARRDACPPNDASCRSETSTCIDRCQRWYGLRTGDPAVTIESK